MNTNKVTVPVHVRCLNSCRKLVLQIQAAKASLIEEFRTTLELQKEVITAAVNEAEAMAWRTDFPQLIFPTLAMEKIRAVAEQNPRHRYHY